MAGKPGTVQIDSHMSLEEVGAALNLTRERIRQIEKQALAKVKTRLEAKGITADLWFSHMTDLQKLERTWYVTRVGDPRGSDESEIEQA